MEETKENQITEQEQKEYAKACTEVLEVLKDAPQEDIAKIPKELLEALESKKDKEYKFETNSYMSFENEDISDTARVILMQIFKEYIMKTNEATEVKKTFINHVDVNNSNAKNEIQDTSETMTDNIEDNIQNDSNEAEKIEQSLVEVKKESLYQRIINFFKKIFNFKRNKNEE